MDEPKDNLERRCPRLGHSVSFKYCRKFGGESGACFKLADCWWEYFDIIRYIHENFPADIADKLIAAAPTPKTSQLLDLIAKAKGRLNE